MYSWQTIGGTGGAIYIQRYINSGGIVTIDKCDFSNVNSPDHGAALYIDDSKESDSYDSEENDFFVDIMTVAINNSRFDSSTAVDSIVYLHGWKDAAIIVVCSSNFANNIGNSLHSSTCALHFCGNVLFENNTSENGGALYFGSKTVVVMVQFVNNAALERGGAIYIELEYDSCGIWVGT